MCVCVSVQSNREKRVKKKWEEGAGGRDGGSGGGPRTKDTYLNEKISEESNQGN